MYEHLLCKWLLMLVLWVDQESEFGILGTI